jgi:hypothetical protein
VNRVVIVIAVVALALAGCRKPAAPPKVEAKPAAPPKPVAARPAAKPERPPARPAEPEQPATDTEAEARPTEPPAPPADAPPPGPPERPAPRQPAPPTASPTPPPPAPPQMGIRRLTKDEIEQRLKTALAPAMIDVSLTQQTPYQYTGTVKDTAYTPLPITVMVDTKNTIRYYIGVPGAGGGGIITPDGRHENRTDIR